MEILVHDPQDHPPGVEEIVRLAEAKGRIIGVRFALKDDEESAPWIIPPSHRRKEAPITGPC
jgi:hypothetical protein